MPSTFVLDMLGTLTGQTPVSQQFRFKISNSSAVGQVTQIVVTTAQAAATTYTNTTGAKCVVLVPASTNTQPWRLTVSTAEAGLLFSSRSPAVIPINATASSTQVHVYTTGGTTFPMTVYEF